MPGIAFYRPTTLYGRIISWFTRSPWCHVGIVHKVYGVTMVTQALVKQGVIPVPVSEYQKPDAVFDMPWIDEEEATAWLMSRWSTPYSLWDVLGIVRFTLTHKAQKNRSGYICSELAAYFLAFSIAGQNFPGGFQSKIGSILDKPAQQVRPKDLADVLL